ncbi:hypothetical protein Strain138_001398 [Pseudogemmatithrix spongiicola]|uniref:DUF4845 domain-containing protein n=1 Tax=Pseudogemmatithrix spongiicola TaxID=3062599 RepID=A0AA49K0L4_9BACT|nr:hypothetical protein Strain138_001398 [Gemmatimonadaceae bacterium 'strain 138']WKW15033.1 hypothetical protein Strain318_001398 [Gemmatimonadaceae bacterium 'strain 318']
MQARRGASTLGCLFSIFLVIAIAYFGINAGRPFWHNYKFQDRMTQEARFAANRSNETIKARLRTYADSLGLPETAQKVHVRRRAGTIEIWADYYVNIEFPLFVREQHFQPRAVGTY